MLAIALPALFAILVSQDTAKTSADSAKRSAALEQVTVRADRIAARQYRPRVTSTAMKTPTTLRETPQSVTQLTAPFLADIAAQGVAKAVEYVPGVTMGQGEGHRDAPTIRGQSTTADFFVDGVRDDAQYYRDMYNVAQVDALKGPTAAIFGRGGGGGVINRVMKRAEWTSVRSIKLEHASWNGRRATLDVGAPVLGKRLATRANVVYEAGDSFRREMGFERVGVTPTAAFTLGRTLWHVGMERFDDRRTVDRGLPSVQGRPSLMPVSTFAGDPSQSYARMLAHSGWAQMEYANGHGFTLRSQLRAFDYDKFYRNVFPNSAINATGTQFAIAAYADGNARRSLFSQTDAIWEARRGRLRSTTLAGVEVSTQRSDVLRETGYFDNVATSRQVSVTAPTVSTPLTFRPSATDPDVRARAAVQALYVQEQIALGDHVQLVAGLRHDQFRSRARNNRTGATFSRLDPLWSPRAAVIVLPTPALSLYGSTSVSYLPSSGDQFAGLTVTTQTLQPEAFRNREVGVKWTLADRVDLSAAWYALERTNTTAPDPLDATRIVQSGRQRTTGGEFGVQGSPLRGWNVMGGVALQHARIISRTSAARAGATVPLVPTTTASLWNKVRVSTPVSLGAGVVHQTRRYAAIDNSVVLPGFTRMDAALFLTLPRGVAAQLNVENLFDSRYAATSHGNNNIMPGSPRAFRVTFSMAP